MSKSLPELKSPIPAWESHFSDSGSGRPSSGRRRPRLGCGGLRGSRGGALPPLHAPSPSSPVLCAPPSPIPAGPGFLTWSRPGLQLPDVPPPPAPTGHSPRPARPARSARAPPWRTWVSGARVPSSAAPHRPPDPLSPAGSPSPSPHLPSPRRPLGSGLCLRLPPDSTSPFLPLPSCRSLDRPLPPCFPRSAPASELPTGGRAGAAPTSGHLGSGPLGKEGFTGSGVRALGK